MLSDFDNLPIDIENWEQSPCVRLSEGLATTYSHEHVFLNVSFDRPDKRLCRVRVRVCQMCPLTDQGLWSRIGKMHTCWCNRSVHLGTVIIHCLTGLNIYVRWFIYFPQVIRNKCIGVHKNILLIWLTWRQPVLNGEYIHPDFKLQRTLWLNEPILFTEVSISWKSSLMYNSFWGT